MHVLQKESLPLTAGSPNGFLTELMSDLQLNVGKGQGVPSRRKRGRPWVEPEIQGMFREGAACSVVWLKCRELGRKSWVTLLDRPILQASHGGWARIAGCYCVQGMLHSPGSMHSQWWQEVAVAGWTDACEVHPSVSSQHG